jgi:hypothetical protein
MEKAYVKNIGINQWKRRYKMTIETDNAAAARAIGSGQVQGVDFADKTIIKPTAVFFVYMRINQDGTFAAYRYYHPGDGSVISSSLDPNEPKSLGYYAMEMAKYARPSTPISGQFEYHGAGLDNFKFPARYSYCVFLMDDHNWKFLTDKDSNPVITFNAEKDGVPFKNHRFAFTSPRLMVLNMPIKGTEHTDQRQAAVMINRMSNKDDEPLTDNEIEQYCFDLWMRVRYANSTNGLTLIIDPTGGNEGPPK